MSTVSILKYFFQGPVKADTGPRSDQCRILRAYIKVKIASVIGHNFNHDIDLNVYDICMRSFQAYYHDYASVCTIYFRSICSKLLL